MTGNRYLDSMSNRFTSPDAASQFLKIVTDPRFDRERLPYFKKFSPENQSFATAQKGFPTNPILGINGGLSFAVCEWMELGYGIFNGYSDGERLLSWLGPMFWLDSEKIIFRITDWRARMAASHGSNNAWACAALTSTDVALDGCVIDYCFDWDRYNWVSVPAGIKPSDFAKPCMKEYPINVFGAQITDPRALRDWELMTKGRLEMLRRMISGNWAATTTGDAYQEDGIIPFFDNFVTRHAGDMSEACMTEFAPVTVPITGVGAVAQMTMFVGSVTDRLRQIEYRTSRLDGSNRIALEDIALIMHPWDAMSITYFQACTTKCSSTFNVNSPSDIAAFWDYFYNKFSAGAFGGGTIRLLDGRELPILQNDMFTQGTVVMLVKGWRGSNPNPYGIRLAAMQYNDYMQALYKVSPHTQLRYQTVLNGSWLKEMPLDGCGDLSLRWNQRLFSNAPWLQTKWTGFPAPSEFTAPTDWPTLPDLPVYTRCVPDPGLA